jgi:hypothetical protein
MIDGSIDLYNHLPQIAEVRLDASAIESAARAVGPVLDFFGVADLVAITLTHRHFNLRSEQIVAWSSEGGELKLRPRAYSASQFAPVTWALSVEGKVTPIEYASVDLIPSTVGAFSNSESFTKLRAELLKRLHTTPLGPNAGISLTPLIFSTFFSTATSTTDQIYEETPDEVSGAMRIAPRATNEFRDLSTTGSENAGASMWAVRDGKVWMLAGCVPCCACR